MQINNIEQQSIALHVAELLRILFQVFFSELRSSSSRLRVVSYKYCFLKKSTIDKIIIQLSKNECLKIVFLMSNRAERKLFMKRFRMKVIRLL